MTQVEQVRESVTTNLEKVLYTAKAHTTGGREGGASRTDDGRLTLDSLPWQRSARFNPEQLFAVGWSACFLSAIKLVAGKKKVTLPTDLAIDIEVDLGIAHGVQWPGGPSQCQPTGTQRGVAQTLVEAANKLAPIPAAQWQHRRRNHRCLVGVA
jgi:Ohr subfamily peroxiredoxin